MTSRKIAFAAVLLTAFAVTAAAPNHGLDPAGMDKSVKPGDDFYA